jgi:hypothetical protein
VKDDQTEGTGEVGIRNHLVRTSAGSSPGRSSGMPSKTRLAPPSAHTRRRAGLERKK